VDKPIRPIAHVAGEMNLGVEVEVTEADKSCFGQAASPFGGRFAHGAEARSAGLEG
jgi:hypothetical protein